ncbi:MAG: hypothetical protein H6865_00065 [Rhodospirillales bacterium]|nr:hypothetical protein [Alphaproteobacteria bacterium]MCB9986020.1 hypothetical protein [Rhodospirillales bacterium]USO07406.1 MAG: hypothetical protein H6866_08305 [Rhodospirillales bacterium]
MTPPRFPAPHFACYAQDNGFSAGLFALREMGVAPDRSPGLLALMDAYCAVHPRVAICKPGTQAQQNAIMAAFATPLRRHLNLLRTNPQPYLLGADDITDDLRCAAVISLQDRRLDEKLRAIITPDTRGMTAIQAGYETAKDVEKAMSAKGTAEMREAFDQLRAYGQICYLLMGCQLARTYIDIRSGTVPEVTARFSTVHGRKILLGFRGWLNELNDAINGHQSALADRLRAMIGTAFRLHECAPEVPKAP